MQLCIPGRNAIMYTEHTLGCLVGTVCKAKSAANTQQTASAA